MAQFIRNILSEILEHFFQPIGEDRIVLDILNGIELKRLIFNDAIINKLMKDKEVDIKLNHGHIGSLRLIWTPLPGILTMQIRELDIRIQPDLSSMAMKQLTKKWKQFSDPFSSPSPHPKLPLDSQRKEIFDHHVVPPSTCQSAYPLYLNSHTAHAIPKLMRPLPMQPAFYNYDTEPPARYHSLLHQPQHHTHLHKSISFVQKAHWMTPKSNTIQRNSTSSKFTNMKQYSGFSYAADSGQGIQKTLNFQLYYPPSQQK